MKTLRKAATTVGLTAALMMAAGPALAHQCMNASKQPDAGVQVIVGGDFETIVWASPQVQSRVANGTIDLESGDGFHGQFGVDFDGDLVPEFVVWVNIGPDGQIPLQAQLRGAACQGIVNIEEYFTDCV